METESWDQFLKLCSNAESIAHPGQLFDFLFTSEERHQLELRVGLVRELLKGEHTQRDIAKLLGVSIAKITRGSNALKRIDDDLRHYLLEMLEISS